MLPWLETHCRDLRERIETQRLGHAPLIHGPRGIGKRELGQWLARLLLCGQPRGGDPCGDCQSCRLFEGGGHPDLFVMEVPEDKQGIGVDQVRDLIERLQLTSVMGAHRVGLVLQADAMNRNAANALLKTLEEPPSGAWLILLSEQPARLPATIRSRCQQWPLRAPDAEVAAAWLADAYPDADAQQREAALQLSAGAPLAALEMLASDDLSAGLAMLDDLIEARPHVEVLERWQADPVASWQWLGRWMNVIMAHASRAGGWQPAGKRLPEALDRRDLARLWQMALDGHREAVRGVVRQDLLLGRWLLEWEASQSAWK
ncbi:MAG: DNA polymerase III subunit delta' [Xanthomonadales bacterium]|nr:DNA polymerase III subunit delta' [Xanthomonadales bacterium]